MAPMAIRVPHGRRLLAGAALLAGGLAATRSPAPPADFVNFESAHVHPLALTPDGSTLLAVNTPGAALAVFDLAGPAPRRIRVIPVGLEPVAVAARNDREAWVVNQVSDGVSIVDLGTGNVRATLRVGDEPNDVVFAGEPERAYVSVGGEDAVKVFDPDSLAKPATIIRLPGRAPRTLAANAARTRVYVALFEGGNRTTTVPAESVGARAPAPDPPRDPALGPAPAVGLVVQWQGGRWVDDRLQDWSAQLPAAPQDVDVVELDVATNAVARTLERVGSHVLALAVSPLDGTVAAAGGDARNLVRFEPRLRGFVVETRLALWSVPGDLKLRTLNPHVRHDSLPGSLAETDSALGQPMDLAFSPSGDRLYVACLGTDKVGVLAPGGRVVARVPVAGGPSGLAVDARRSRLYVLDRFREQLETLDLTTLGRVAIASLGFDPTPDEVVNGRRHFYSGGNSAHGDQSCSSCHLFGDSDRLAWDLGDPRGAREPPPHGETDAGLTGFDPMKGPMVTLSLRGLRGLEPFHWRGDRPDLAAFNRTFVDLLGRAAPLPDSAMASLERFLLSLRQPPNPRLRLDGSVAGPGAARGEHLFRRRVLRDGRRCADCHSGPSGTDGRLVSGRVLGISQDMKVARLRGLYRKAAFAHDGSAASIAGFLESKHFLPGAGAVALAQRRDLEAFLLSFDTGMPPAVGRQVTFGDPEGSGAARVATLDTLVRLARRGVCDLIAKGVANGQQRGWVLMGDGTFQSDRRAEGRLDAEALRRLAMPGGEITFTGVPPGCGVRMGVDADRDGRFDRDERDRGTDPETPDSSRPGPE